MWGGGVVANREPGSYIYIYTGKPIYFWPFIGGPIIPLITSMVHFGSSQNYLNLRILTESTEISLSSTQAESECA